MMAHDPSTPRPELSTSARTALESALGKLLDAPDQTASLERALRTVTAEAREKQIQAEHLLVLLKDLWFGLPAVKAAPSGEHQNALLQRAVSQCIREYYAS